MIHLLMLLALSQDARPDHPSAINTPALRSYSANAPERASLPGGAQLLVIEDDFARSFQYVIKFGGSLVVVRFCPVDVHRVGPCGDVFVVLADQTIAVAAGAAFIDGLVLVTQEQVARKRSFVF